MAQPSPIHWWKSMVPWVVRAEKFGATSLIRSDMGRGPFDRSDASERRARAGQEGQLLGGRRPTQDRVAVGEAAEARDDVAVAHGEVVGLLVAQGREQLDAAVLLREVLGVHERHVEEGALRRRQLAIGAARDPVEREAQRL